jgi:hypothetical protein
VGAGVVLNELLLHRPADPTAKKRRAVLAVAKVSTGHLSFFGGNGYSTENERSETGAVEGFTRGCDKYLRYPAFLSLMSVLSPTAYLDASDVRTGNPNRSTRKA